MWSIVVISSESDFTKGKNWVRTHLMWRIMLLVTIEKKTFGGKQYLPNYHLKNFNRYCCIFYGKDIATIVYGSSKEMIKDAKERQVVETKAERASQTI